MTAQFAIQDIPELRDDLRKYGVSLDDNPPYVLIGVLNSPSIGKVIGILAFAGNEFHAYLLRQKLSAIGLCNIEVTEYHPSPGKKKVFHLRQYLKKLAAKRSKDRVKF
jgi:hypothetical protein